MNEPKHPHFVLSDGQYCHLMEEGMIITKKDLPEKRPAQNDGTDYFSVAMLGAGIGVMLFFLYFAIQAGFSVLMFMLLSFASLMGFYLIRMLGYSQTPFIPKEDVTGVEYKKRNWGYDSFIVHYAGKNGKPFKRRLMIYDSEECLNQALQVMKEQGYLK